MKWINILSLLILFVQGPIRAVPMQKGTIQAIPSIVNKSVNAARVLEGVIDSGRKLSELVLDLNEMFLKPITDQIDAEISKVNTNIEGLTAAEKQMVEDARLALYNSRFGIARTRSVLSNLAEDTISRCNTMLKILKVVLSGIIPTNRQMAGIRLAVKRMESMLERSKELLKEARIQYAMVAKQLNIVRVRLELFSVQLNQLSDITNSRFKDHERRTHDLVFATAAYCIFVASHCPAAYAVAAATLQTKLTEYRNSVNTLQAECMRSKNEATKLANKAAKDLKYMEQGDRLIGEWKSKVHLLYDEFKQGDYINDAVDLSYFGVDPTKPIKDLVKACQAYLKHVSLVNS